MTPEPSEEERAAVKRLVEAACAAVLHPAGSSFKEACLGELRAAVRCELAAEREGHQSDMDSLRRRHEQELARVRAERDSAIETMETTHDMRELELAGAAAQEREAWQTALTGLNEELERSRAKAESEQDAAIASTPRKRGEAERCITTSASRSGAVAAYAICISAIEAIRARGTEPANDFTARLARAIYESDNGYGSGALHDLLAEVGGKPHNAEAEPLAGAASARRPLLPGWGWHESIDGAYDLRGPGEGFLTNTASAHVSGRWAIYDKRGNVMAEDTATARPGETPLAAAQREVEEECCGRGLFGEVG